jgi:hypothetical protein
MGGTPNQRLLLSPIDLPHVNREVKKKLQPRETLFSPRHGIIVCLVLRRICNMRQDSGCLQLANAHEFVDRFLVSPGAMPTPSRWHSNR